MDGPTQVREWPGTLDASLLEDSAVSAGHRLADAAKSGDWEQVRRLLDRNDHLNVNQVRPGGTSWFTVLHQLAWHGHPLVVLDELLRRGALRTLRDARGRRPQDVAVDRHGPESRMAVLLSPPESPLRPDRQRALDDQLARLIEKRLHADGTDRDFGGRPPRQVLRYPPVEVLHELPGHQVWFPVPGMYGGFHILLRRGYLEVSSWIRVVEGSEQTHVITHEGATLVEGRE